MIFVSYKTLNHILSQYFIRPRIINTLIANRYIFMMSAVIFINKYKYKKVAIVSI